MKEIYVNKDILNELYIMYVTDDKYTLNDLCIHLKNRYDITLSISPLMYKLRKEYPKFKNERRKNIYLLKQARKQKDKLVKKKKIVKENKKIIVKTKTSKKLKKKAEKKKIDKKKRLLSERNLKIVELYNQGLSMSEIAKQFNLTRSRISDLLQKLSKIDEIYIKSKEERKDREKIIKKKLKDITYDNIINWFNETGSKTGVHRKCVNKGIKISVSEIAFLLNEVLHIKKFCLICKEEMDITKVSYCSEKCRKEGIRRHQLNGQKKRRKHRGNGMNIQYVSTYELVRMAKGICYLCNEQLDINIDDSYHPLYVVIDHVNPLYKSKDSTYDNLRPTCRCCNGLKGTKEARFYTVEQYRNNKQEKFSAYKPKLNRNIINRSEFRTDCENGMSINELSDKYNRSSFSISKLKKNLGLAKHVNTEERMLEIVFLSKEGTSVKQICDMLSIGTTAVSRYRKKAREKGLL